MATKVLMATKFPMTTKVPMSTKVTLATKVPIVQNVTLAVWLHMKYGLVFLRFSREKREGRRQE